MVTNQRNLMKSRDEPEVGLEMASGRTCKCREDINKGKKLIDAAEKDSIEELFRLLETGGSVNAEEYNKSLFYESKNYMTPLQVAAANGHHRSVELLISREAELNARDRFDVTALHMAAENGHYKCLKLLLDAGAECNISTKYSKLGCYTAKPHPGGTTPLHLAAAKNHVHCVKELIQNGADYNATDEQGRTSLYIAAEGGLDECVLVHLKNAIGRDILSLPVLVSGDTPLHWCVKLGMKECVIALLDHGSDVNHRNLLGYSPLHYAVFHNTGNERLYFDIMKELVLRGHDTDVNLPDGRGLTPLHFVCFADGAKMERRPEAAAFLIAYGAHTHIKNKRGNYLLQVELKNGRLDRTILKAIVKSLPHVPSLMSLNLASLLPTSEDIMFLMSSLPSDELMNGSGGDCFLQGNNIMSCSKGFARYQWYNRFASSPRSLQHYSRCAIRLALGYRRLRCVKELPLPSSLKEYLLLEYDEFK